MSYPLVRELAAEGIPVRLTCGVLGHSRQAYYAWLTNPVSQRELEDAYLTNALIDAHSDDPEFGYRFLSDELERAGHVAGERRVWRLCSQQKLWSCTVRKGRRGSGKTRSCGPRRPRPARLHRARARPGLADRHHRAPHRRGQALLLRDQGPVQQPDRRLRDRRTDDRPARRPHATHGRGSPPADGRRGGSQRPRVAISGAKLPGRPDRRRAARLDGPGRLGRRQRRHGVLARAAAEERPGPPTLAHPRRAARGHRVLDRAHLQPPPTPTALGKLTPVEYELAFTAQAAAVAA